MARDTYTQLMSTQTTPQHSQHSNANSSSMSFSNGTVSNGSGSITISNLGNYYTTAGTSISNAVWDVYTNYMKPKSFKLR